jgi:hypothetical protein
MQQCHCFADLQAYISCLKLEGLALSSDMVYVTQVRRLTIKGMPWKAELAVLQCSIAF